MEDWVSTAATTWRGEEEEEQRKEIRLLTVCRPQASSSPAPLHPAAIRHPRHLDPPHGTRLGFRLPWLCAALPAPSPSSGLPFASPRRPWHQRRRQLPLRHATRIDCLISSGFHESRPRLCGSSVQGHTVGRGRRRPHRFVRFCHPAPQEV
jgi:hypothetical protein